MKLFRSALDDWEKNMTEEDLRKMEAQGCDVSAYREKLNKRRAEEAAQAAEDLKKYYNPTDLSMLEPFIATPRSTDTEFFRAVAGKAPWFGKSKWLRKYQEGKIVYAGVIDIAPEGCRPPKHKDDHHYCVAIYAIDDKHIHNVEWLKGLMKTLGEMRDGKRPAPGELQGLMAMFGDESNWDQKRLPSSIAGGAEVWHQRLGLDASKLPKGYLPTDGIVPHFYWEGTISQIPAQFYSK